MSTLWVRDARGREAELDDQDLLALWRGIGRLLVRRGWATTAEVVVPS